MMQQVVDRRILSIVFGAVLLLWVASACSDSSPPSAPVAPAEMVDNGSWYSRNAWPHDGNPIESQNFIVYSDAASLEARQRLAELAEETLADLIAEMGIDPETMFRLPPEQGKIDLYANKNNLPDWGGPARGYYAGLIIMSFDHQIGEWPANEEFLGPILKHELVHVVESLLKGRFVGDIPVDDPRRMPVWFSEGTAEALSGGTTGGAPRTLDEVNGLIAEYGRINPIAWRVDLPPSELVGEEYPRYYYPMAQLAVEYLLDADGLGRSPRDLSAVMLDMGNDVSFVEAFENHIGISQSDYETQFFARMDTYLPQSEFPLEAIGVGLSSLLAATLMGGSLIWGFRHWSAAATTTGETSESAWGRRSRRGFLVEISVVAVIAVGLAALLVYQITFADLPPYKQRAPGYLATAAYLLASVSILMWAIRRWANRSRGAYLIPLLTIAATAMTIITIELIV